MFYDYNDIVCFGLLFNFKWNFKNNFGDENKYGTAVLGGNDDGDGDDNKSFIGNDGHSDGDNGSGDIDHEIDLNEWIC